MNSRVLIYYATTFGNAQSAATLIAEVLTGNGYPAEVVNLADCDVSRLSSEERPLIFCASTFGHGDPPADCRDFWDALRRLPDGALGGQHFAVYALGDRTHRDFCGFGRRLDECLERAGASRMVKRVDNDSYWEEDVPAFSKALLRVLRKGLPAALPS